MKNIKAIVIDDERNAVESIVTILTRFCPAIDVVGTAFDASGGILLARGIKPDLAFIDVEMPDATGFDVVNCLKDINCLVVFVTAYEQYAIKAFKANAIDYVLKPVGIDEIQQVVEKARKLLVKKEQGESPLETTRVVSEKISLPTGKGILFVDITDIVYIEADGRYSNFHLDGKEAVFVTKNLGEVEEMLASANFFRAHHSALVNINRVVALNVKDGNYIEMNNGAKVALSRRRKDEFLKRFGGKS